AGWPRQPRTRRASGTSSARSGGAVGRPSPRRPAEDLPPLRQVLGQELHGARTCEGGAGGVVAAAGVAVEAVPRRVDVHGDLRMRRPDLPVVIGRDLLVRLTE